MARLAPPTLLHLVEGPTARTLLSEALEEMGRPDDKVIAFHEALQVGPLHRIDETSALRLDWWRKVYSAMLEPEEAASLDSLATWNRLHQAYRDHTFVVWHGPHPGDRTFALRAFSQLRAHRASVLEVRIPGPTNSVTSELIVHGAVGMETPARLARAWALHHSVADAELDRYATEWQVLCSREGDWFRELDGDAFTHLPVDAHDPKILSRAGEWTTPVEIIASVLTEVPVGYDIVAWRCRQLLLSRALRGRGWSDAHNMPAELKSA